MQVNIERDPERYTEWYLRQLPEDHLVREDPENQLPVVLELHAWLFEQREASSVRDIVHGLLRDPVLFEDVRRHLAGNTFTDFSIESELGGDQL